MTRVLVCGGRDYKDRARVFAELDKLAGVTEAEPLGTKSLTVIHGACPSGADLWANQWAVVNWAAQEPFEARWKAQGRSAGPKRNQRMIDEGKPDLVIAFPGGSGTADCVRRAKAAGIEVIEVPSPLQQGDDE